MRLTSQRLEELEGLRRAGQLLDVQGSKTLGEYVEHHVDRKAREGTSERHVALVRLHLQTVVEYFGDSRDLASIQPKGRRNNNSPISAGRQQRGWMV